MEITIKIFLVIFLTLSSLNATEILDEISVHETLLSPSSTLIEDENQINNQTLSEKLFNAVVVNQTGDGTSANIISIRANNYRATEYYEDGIPLYKTAFGFTDLSMYRANNTDIILNAGGG